MSRSPRRLLAAIATTVTLAAGGAVGLAAAATPAGAAAPAASHHAAPSLGLPIDPCTLDPSLPTCPGGGGLPVDPPVDPCSLVPTLPTCPGGGTTPAACDGTVVLGICVPTGGSTDPTAVCETLLTSLGLTADQAATACATLDVGGGTPTLPTGASSAVPNTFPNNATAQQVVITDPFEQLYSAAGGATVTLDGASTIPTTVTPVLDDTAGTITATFNLTLPTPATPGAYTLTIEPTDPTGLTAVLGGLGLPTTLPADTVPVTVTAATGPGPVTGLTATPINGTSASLKWTAPAGATPAVAHMTPAATPAVTGYAVFVSKTATSPTANDPGITVTQTGTATTASVSGLTAGTKYNVSVAAKSAGGNGPAVTTTFTTPYVSSLTLVTNPSSAIEGGGKLEMSGELDHMVNGAKTPLSGKTVGLLVKYTHATHSTKITTVTTNGSGKYDFTFTPTGGGQFVAAFLGDAATATTPGDSYAVSNIVPVTDTPAVTLTGTSKKSGKKHEFLKLKGSVSPTEQGKKVFIFSTGGGADQKIGKARIASNGKYALKKRVKKGNYTLEARVKAHGPLLAASSHDITL